MLKPQSINVVTVSPLIAKRTVTTRSASACPAVRNQPQHSDQLAQNTTQLMLSNVARMEAVIAPANSKTRSMSLNRFTRILEMLMRTLTDSHGVHAAN